MSRELLIARIVELSTRPTDYAEAIAAIDPLIEMLKQGGYEGANDIFDLWWDAEQVNAIPLGEQRPPSEAEKALMQERLDAIRSRLTADLQHPSK